MFGMLSRRINARIWSGASAVGDMARVSMLV